MKKIKWYKNSDIHYLNKKDGCFNKSADKVKRKDTFWSGLSLDKKFTENDKFDRLRCRNCGGKIFEVLCTDSYETSAKCLKCKMYYIVHMG